MTVHLDFSDLRAIAQHFAPADTIAHIQPLGNGNINDTFLVRLDDAGPAPLEQRCWVLQRINTQVFPQPQGVMQNMRQVTEHVQRHLQQSPPDRRWEIPHVLLTTDGRDHWSDGPDSFWRAISFIEKAESFETMQSTAQAEEVGYALGMFHQLISDLSPSGLVDTLVGFHITPLYLQHYDRILANTHISPSPDVKYALDFIRDRRDFASVLEQAKENDKLPLRLMHGDPKINNVMFDRTTKKAVSLVDLDTVKPGLVHYDIGDCLRSGCNPLGEETRDWQSVWFDPDLCRAILTGYLAVANRFLTDSDYLYMYDAIRLLPFELGLRFFTDYLAGNVYFKVSDADHNLARALVQFQLTASIEAQEATLRTMIQDWVRNPI
jgi:Ser/Thr protein kinase RdoA (MazF antagonist)